MLSIIIPYYGNESRRQEALGLLLRTLSMQDFQGKTEVILVYQGTETDLMHQQPLLLSVVDQFIFLGDNLTHFNKSWCINVAVRAAAYDFFCVVDADMIFGLDYIRLLNHCISLHSFCVGWTSLICSPGKDQPYYRQVTATAIETAGGVFAFNKNFFIEHVGMMNENYEGYGGEDNDVFYRVRRVIQDGIGGAIFYMPYALLHYYHDWLPGIEANVELLRSTRNHMLKVIDRLKAANLGNEEAPTLIDMDNFEVLI